jgi:hypothetical protein
LIALGNVAALEALSETVVDSETAVGNAAEADAASIACKASDRAAKNTLAETDAASVAVADSRTEAKPVLAPTTVSVAVACSEAVAALLCPVRAEIAAEEIGLRPNTSAFKRF